MHSIVSKNLQSSPPASVVTKTLDVETEAKTEAAEFKTEAKAEAVYLKTEAEAQGSWSMFLANRRTYKWSRLCYSVASVCLLSDCQRRYVAKLLLTGYR